MSGFDLFCVAFCFSTRSHTPTGLHFFVRALNNILTKYQYSRISNKLGAHAYSHLFNKRGAWNKRGGGAKVAKSLNVELGIKEEGGIFGKN